MGKVVKQVVCSNCGNSIHATDRTGKTVCPICGSYSFKKAELPETIHCIHCKKESQVADILKIWKDIPFYDENTKSYYCGCRGWD